MAYASNEPQSIPTLAAALQNQTVDNLKKFAALVNDAETKPARKADLIAFILRHTDGELGRLRQVEDDPLQALWRKLAGALAQARCVPAGGRGRDRPRSGFAFGCRAVPGEIWPGSRLE